MSTEKGFEIMVFIVLIMVICVLMFPIFEKIIYNAQESTAKTKVNAIADTVKNVYLKENQKIDNVVYLPFSVEFTENGYITYCDGKEIYIETEVVIKGEKPVSGTVTWTSDNNIVVKDLKFNSHTCSKDGLGNIECVRNS